MVTTINSGWCLLIGIAATIDLGCRLLIGIAATIGFACCTLIGTAATIYFGCYILIEMAATIDLDCCTYIYIYIYVALAATNESGAFYQSEKMRRQLILAAVVKYSVEWRQKLIFECRLLIEIAATIDLWCRNCGWKNWFRVVCNNNRNFSHNWFRVVLLLVGIDGDHRPRFLFDVKENVKI